MRVVDTIQEQGGLKRAPTEEEVKQFSTKFTRRWNDGLQEYEIAFLLDSESVRDIDINLLRRALAEHLDFKTAPTIMLFPGNEVV